MVQGNPSIEPQPEEPGYYPPYEAVEDDGSYSGLREFSADTEADTPKKKFGIPWKAIYTFLGVFGGQLLTRSLVDGVAVIPKDLKELAALVGASFLAALGVYFKSNTYTVPQAEKIMNKAKYRELTGS